MYGYLLAGRYLPKRCSTPTESLGTGYTADQMTAATNRSSTGEINDRTVDAFIAMVPIWFYSA
jgi:hypothetical protein